jgi:hypothetical protein
VSQSGINVATPSPMARHLTGFLDLLAGHARGKVFRQALDDGR